MTDIAVLTPTCTEAVEGVDNVASAPTPVSPRGSPPRPVDFRLGCGLASEPCVLSVRMYFEPGDTGGNGSVFEDDMFDQQLLVEFFVERGSFVMELN